MGCRDNQLNINPRQRRGPLTEMREVTNAVTGETTSVEYYSHDEFMALKRQKLAELRAKMIIHAAVIPCSLSQIEFARHLVDGVQLAVELQQVRASTGPMLVSKA